MVVMKWEEIPVQTEEPYPKSRIFTVLRNSNTNEVYLADGMEVIYGPGIDRGLCRDKDPTKRIEYYICNPGPDIYDLLFDQDVGKRTFYQFEKRKFYREMLSLSLSKIDRSLNEGDMF